MPDNLINGNFTTINVSSIREENNVTKGGYIVMNYDGVIDLHGEKLFINFRDNIELRNDGSLILNTTGGDLLFNSEVGHVLIESGAPGMTSIYINASNTNGGILMESGTSGVNILTEMGDISIISKGKDINIGYSDGSTTFDPTKETQNINIESQNYVNVNTSTFQVIASDTISFLGGEIIFGPSPTNPFLQIKDDCLLIDPQEQNELGIKKVMIDVSSSSISKPTYDGLLIRSFNDDVSTDITLKNSDSKGGISFGIEAPNSINGNDETFIAYKVSNKIIPLQSDSGRDITSEYIGKTFYWTVDEVSEVITGLSTYITPASTYSSNTLVTGGVYTGFVTKYYKVEIDDENSTPNKFKWSNDGGKTYQDEFVYINSSAMTLEDGITITFPQTTGFSLGDYWTFSALPVATTNETGNRNSQVSRITKPGLGYLTVAEPQGFQIKTSDQERLRITDNGQVGIGTGKPSATFEVTNKVGKRIILSTDYENQQINPSVAGLTSGGWVAVWESYTGSSNKYDIFGQIFYPDGTRNGSQFRINDSNNQQNNQSYPFVVGTNKPNSGGFLVIWSSETETLTPGVYEYNIMGQLYDADRSEENRKIMDGDIQINSDVPNITIINKYPRACSLNNQSNNYPYVIVWSSNYPDGGVNNYCYLRILSFSGNLQNSEFLVNPALSLSHTYPDITPLQEDDPLLPRGFVVGFMCEYDTNLFDIRYQLFDGNYIKYGDSVLVSKTETINGVNPSKTYGRLSLEGLTTGGFIVTYNQSYKGDNSILSLNDTISGLNSSAIGQITNIDNVDTSIITINLLSGTFLNGEDFITDISARVGRIETIRFISGTYYEIVLSNDVKTIKANKYITSSSNPVYTINNVNTSQFIDDQQLQTQDPSEQYTLPVLSETFDKNFVIAWANGKIPNIYYQKFNYTNGEKIGNETMIQPTYQGVVMRNPSISYVFNKNTQDQGLVLVYDSETFDYSHHGVFAELINNDNPFVKIWNGTSTTVVTNYGSVGLGTEKPEASIHIQNETPSILLQNTNDILGSNLASSKIQFKDYNGEGLAEIKGCYTSSYDTRNPQFNNLVRWFKFNETYGSNIAIDSSRNNIQATLNNLNVYDNWVSGKIDNALLFNQSGYLDCGNDSTINEIAQGGFSISSWIKIFPGSETGSDFTIISTGSTTSGNYQFRINTDFHLVGILYTSNTNEFVTGTTNVADGLWHNVVMTYDPSLTSDHLKLYFDSILENSYTVVGTVDIPLDITNVYIGTTDSINNFYNGLMDDFRIYNTPLSEIDIGTLFNNIDKTRGKIIFKTNNGEGIPESDTIRNFTIDADGFIENLRTRSLPDSTITGTLTPNGNIITGSNGTKFLSEINIGDTITINNYQRVVIKIISDTELEINESLTGFASGPYINVQRKPSVLSGLDANSVLKLLLNAEGRLSIGRADTVAKLVISGTNDVNDYPNIYLKNYTTGGSINQIAFFGRDDTDIPYQIGQILTDAVPTTTEGIFRFYLNNNQQNEQRMVLTSNGYLGLGGDTLFTPTNHLEIRDNNTNNLNILLESGSDDTVIGGAASNINFKSKNVNDNYAVIKGSSDSDVNDSKGRIDFITNNGTIETYKMTIKSNNKIGLYIPEPINSFNVSPPQSTLFTGTITLNGTALTGVGTAFTNKIIGDIIYFEDDKVSRVITGYNSPTSLTVSISGTFLTPQSYAIYKAGINVDTKGQIGLGVCEPTSTVHLAGSLATNYVFVNYSDTVGGIYDLTDTSTKSQHNTYLVNTVPGPITFLLPDTGVVNGRIYNIKKIAGSHAIILNGYGPQLIDTVAQYNLTLSNQAITIQSNGLSGVSGKWYILNLLADLTTIFTDTDGLPEGQTNLYFTEQRVIDVVQNNITTNNIDEFGITNLYFSNNRVINVIQNLVGTNDLQETGLTNLYFTSSRVVDAVHDNITTIDIDESGTSNLYFTTQRVIDAVQANITTNDVDEFGITNLYFTNNRVINVIQTLVGTNDLQETGITNLYFTTQRVIDAVQANITTMDIDEAGVTNLYFSTQRVIDAVQNNITTNDVPEFGITNLYFTNNRVKNVIQTLVGTNDLQETGITNLYFTTQRVVNAVQANITTMDIDEAGLTNLYFSTQRVLDVLQNNLTTNDVPEFGNTNLYFTAARARDAVIDIFESLDTLSTAFDPIGSAINVQNTLTAQINNLTTADIPESGLTNLYFNSARLQTAFNTGISTSSSLTVSGAIYRPINTVTQLTSQTTDVTINAANGIITTVNISLAANAADYFVVNNTSVSLGDQVFAMINGKSGTPQSGLLVPIVSIYNIVNNSFNIIIRNPHSVDTCEGVYDISYQIIKHT